MNESRALMPAFSCRAPRSFVEIDKPHKFDKFYNTFDTLCHCSDLSRCNVHVIIIKDETSCHHLWSFASPSLGFVCLSPDSCILSKKTTWRHRPTYSLHQMHQLSIFYSEAISSFILFTCPSIHTCTACIVCNAMHTSIVIDFLTQWPNARAPTMSLNVKC